MKTDNRAAIIMGSLDLLAGYEYLPTENDKIQLLETVNDTLSQYPKPTQKGTTPQPAASTLGAYLLISNARNAVKLSKLGLWAIFDGCKVAVSNLEMALTLLID